MIKTISRKAQRKVVFWLTLILQMNLKFLSNVGSCHVLSSGLICLDHMCWVSLITLVTSGTMELILYICNSNLKFSISFNFMRHGGHKSRPSLYNTFNSMFSLADDSKDSLVAFVSSSVLF